MKANGLHAHDVTLDNNFLRLIRSVKSSATDSEALEIIVK